MALWLEFICGLIIWYVGHGNLEKFSFRKFFLNKTTGSGIEPSIFRVGTQSKYLTETYPLSYHDSKKFKNQPIKQKVLLESQIGEKVFENYTYFKI